MTTVVVDASIVASLALQDEHATAVEAQIAGTETEWAAPELIDLELASVLRREEGAARITKEYGEGALSDYLALHIERFAHRLLLPRIWELRRNLTAYDAAYVALAEALDAPLLTLDRSLATAPGHHARVEVL